MNNKKINDLNQVIDSTGELTVRYEINFICPKHDLNPINININKKKAYCLECVFEFFEKNGIMPMEIIE